MEVFYDNPDCKNEGEDLPYSGGYQTLEIQIPLWVHVVKTCMVAKKDEFLCYLSMSLVCFRISLIVKAYLLKHRCLLLPR
jgi:hypothetical protein